MEPVHPPPATTSPHRKPRLLILVDGTNFQASMREAGLAYPIDFPRLAHQLAKTVDGGSILVKLRFYAAHSASPGVRKREAVLFDVLRRSSATELVEGWHERKECTQCHKPYHREKETDVNLAVDLVDGAHRDRYDVALVISGDSDFVPAIERVRTVTKIHDGVPARKRVVWGHFAHQAHVSRIRNASGETLLLDDKLLRTCKRNNLPRRRDQG